MKRSIFWIALVTLIVLAFGLSACQPAAEAPIEEPAVTEAPAEAPAEEPAATEPPVEEPAATEPPAEEPAATEPPAEEPGEETGEPQYGGTLTFAMKEDVTSMDPLKAIQYGDIRLNILVAQQLVAPNRAGEFVGVLAERWETSEDGREWTFYLRPGVKFHNGADLTAEDVEYIFNRILDEESGAALRSTFVNIGLQVEVVDPQTVKMTIESGMGPFLCLLYTSPSPRD